MDKGLQEELKRAFHSTAKAQAVKNQLSSVYGTMKKFNRDYNRTVYSNYQVYFKMIIARINVLAWSVEEDRKIYIRENAEQLIKLSCQFDGYIECLFDLNIVSESEYDKFFDFTKQIRYDANEILLYLDNTI